MAAPLVAAAARLVGGRAAGSVASRLAVARLGAGEMAFGVELVGDWAKAAQMLSTLEKVGTNAALKAGLKVYSDRAYNELKLRAMSRLKPLAKGTLIKRKFLGIKGSTPLHATGDLYEHIKIIEVGDTYQVGFEAGTTHGPSGMNLVQLVKMHEKGFVQFIDPTPKMLLFLRRMLGGRETGDRNRGARKGNAQIVVTVPARPLFAHVVEELDRQRNPIQQAMLQAMARVLQQHGIIAKVGG